MKTTKRLLAVIFALCMIFALAATVLADEPADDCTHSNMEYTAAVEPTEHSEGHNEYWYCPDCDTYFSDAEGQYNTNPKREVIVPLHNDFMTYTAEVPATEHSNGMHGYWYCSECDSYFTNEDRETPVAVKSLTILCSHNDYMEYHAEVPAGEHTTGMAAYWYCSECDSYFAADDRETPVASKSLTTLPEHNDYMEYHAEVAATEHSNGMAAYWYCSECNSYFAADDLETPVASKSLTILCSHNDYMEYHAEVPAGEHTKGMAAYWYCSECDSYFAADDRETPVASKTLTILPEHNIEYRAEVAPTEHSDGMRAHWYCADCDNYYEADDTDLQYPIASKTLVIPCEHSDSMTYTEEVPAGEHTKGMAAYWYCSECDSYFTADDRETPVASKTLTILPEHSIVYRAEVAPTEHSNGMQAHWYCEDCDTYHAADDVNLEYPIASKTLVIPCEHSDFMTFTEEVPAGEHTKGMAAYWYCSKCDSYFAADDRETPVASKTLTILPEHSIVYHAEVPAGEHTNGMAAYWYCEDCDTYHAADDVNLEYPIASKTLVILAEHADSMQFRPEVPATETENGMMAHWYCAECDTYYAADDTEFKYPVPSKSLVLLATGTPDVPKTDDSFNVVLMSVLLLAVGAGVAVLTVSKKKFF